MRVVLDTNVLLSALISPHGVPDKICNAWRDGRFELVTSKEQLDELRRASRYKKLKAILPAHRVGALINNMQHAIVLNESVPLTRKEHIELHDPDDVFLISMIFSIDVDYLVTGDNRAGLLKRGHIGRTRIVTPVDFCKLAL